MNHKTVNINNFEEVALDYFDGKLPEEAQRSLFAFLEAHPQFMADFELFQQSETAAVTPNSVTFPCPERLKKNVIFSENAINESNYQDYFIAFYENDLDELERQTLSAFLEKNAFLLPEFERFGKLRLVPDKTVIFNGKRQLKHSPFRVRRSVALWFVAASVAAGFLLFFLLKTTTDMPTTTYEPPFVKTDNHPETSSDTTYHTPTPNENPIPQKEPKPVVFVAHTPKITSATDEPTAEPQPEIVPSEQETEIVTFVSEEIVRTLEPDVVVIKTISETETDPETEESLAFYQEQQQKKRPLLKILSWGVKQYNYISNNDITVMQVENLTTNETVYYLCRGE